MDPNNKGYEKCCPDSTNPGSSSSNRDARGPKPSISSPIALIGSERRVSVSLRSSVPR